MTFFLVQKDVFFAFFDKMTSFECLLSQNVIEKVVQFDNLDLLKIKFTYHVYFRRMTSFLVQKDVFFSLFTKMTSFDRFGCLLSQNCHKKVVQIDELDLLRKNFFQETHSTPSLEKIWKSDWGGDIFFSHGKSNSTGCAIAFSDNFSVKVKNQARDDCGRLLILEVTINDTDFLLINLYNANYE